MKQADPTGITDWRLKQLALKILTHKGNVAAAAAEEICKRTPANVGQGAYIAGRFSSWYTSSPDQYIWFFDEFAKYCGCPDHITGIDVIRSTYSQFVRFLPWEKQALLNARLPIENLPAVYIDPLSTHNDQLRQLEMTIGERKFIDQHFLYLHHHSVGRWSRLIRQRAYNPYEDCISGLQKILRTPEWVELITTNKIQAVVDLGVGTGEKSPIIIKSILKHQQGSVRLIAIDSSFNMLECAIHEIIQAEREVAGRLELIPIKADFVNRLTYLERYIEQSSKKTLFMLLGNTLGNISEAKFLTSLQEVTKAGDIILISLELLSIESAKKQEMEFLEEYDNDDVREFVISSLQLFFPDNLPHNLRGALRFSLSAPNEYSSVEGAQAIVGKADIGGTEVVIFHSNRYILQNLIAYFGQYGFKYYHETPSPLNPLYRQVIFRKLYDGTRTKAHT